MNVKKVVADTNVISAIFWQGYPREVYENIKKNKVILLSSSDIENEFIRVLGYNKFNLSPKQIIPLIEDLIKYLSKYKIGY